MANTLLDAQGFGIRNSLTEEKMLNTAEAIIREISSKKM